MKLTFWGAARQVTGSLHYLKLDNGFNILIDSGMQYENGQAIEVNNDLPLHPKDVNLIILTHAHIDHSGNIPNLVKKGFKGPIYCTAPTASLVEKLLFDSVNVQLLNSRPNKKSRSKKAKKDKSTQTLYTHLHVKYTVDQLKIIPFYQKTEICNGYFIELFPAGHILGAASVIIENTTNIGKPIRIGFTGDLGKRESKMIVDPEMMPKLNYLVTESTYGDKFHKYQGKAEDILENYVIKNCIENQGRLVIPAFSVGRTQSILFTLHQLYKKGVLGEVKIFADSPLGIASTKIYEEFSDYLNPEAQDWLDNEHSLFDFENLVFLNGTHDYKQLEYYFKPCIIVSSAGMVEGGRIQEHVKNNLSNPLCTILIAGYCAEGTLGHKLLMGQNTVNIQGQERHIYAKIAQTDCFSAHPDQTGLINYIEQYKSKEIKQIFLVHGDLKAMDSLETVLNNKGISNIEKPIKGQTYELN